MQELRLYQGTKFTGITVRPDEKYPQMYRVHWPDREPSVMVNLTRAKDAAHRFAVRSGSKQVNDLSWKARESHRRPVPAR